MHHEHETTVPESLKQNTMFAEAVAHREALAACSSSS